MRTVAQWLFIVCLPVLLLAASIAVVANNLSLWPGEYGSERYNIGQTLAYSGLELADSELKQVYADLVSYFNSGEEYVSLTVVSNGSPLNLFTTEEVIHFKDVKGLIWLDYWLLLGTLIYILVYAGVNFFWLKDRRRLAWGLVWGSGLTIVLILVLVVLDAILGFGELWYQFHLLFFANPYWSAEGYMLLLFPERFFADVAIFCVVVMVVGALILGGVGWWRLRKVRHS